MLHIPQTLALCTVINKLLITISYKEEKKIAFNGSSYWQTKIEQI
jgi:hypothetical protein